MIQQSYFKGHFRPKPNLQLEVPVELNYWTQQMPCWEKLQEINHRFHHCKPRKGRVLGSTIERNPHMLVVAVFKLRRRTERCSANSCRLHLRCFRITAVGLRGTWVQACPLRWLSICLQKVGPHGPRWFRLIHSTLDISTIKSNTYSCEATETYQKEAQKKIEVCFGDMSNHVYPSVN